MFFPSLSKVVFINSNLLFIKLHVQTADSAVSWVVNYVLRQLSNLQLNSIYISVISLTVINNPKSPTLIYLTFDGNYEVAWITQWTFYKTFATTHSATVFISERCISLYWFKNSLEVYKALRAECNKLCLSIRGCASSVANNCVKFFILFK